VKVHRIAGVLLLFVANLCLADVVTVKNLRMWRAPDHTRLVLDLSRQVEHQLFTLDDPDRLVLDLQNARLLGGLPSLDLSGPYLRRVRTGTQKDRVLRIVLDLKRKVRPRTFVLTPNRIYGHRLVIDLYAKEDSEKAVPKDYTPPPRERSAKIVVAIDAGHGGEDPGAIGRIGTREKVITLKVARELRKLIERDADMRPVMIRKGDYYLSLRRRIATARRHQADVFLSIHADAFPSRKVRGASVYALSQRGATNEQARWLADKENAADLVGGVSLRDQDDVLAKVILDLQMTDTVTKSLELGQDVLRELSRVGPTHRRHVQQAGFVVLKSPDVPSILVETAFLSNPKEERQLRNAKHRRRVANAIYKGIKRYFRRHPVRATAAQADVEYVVRSGDSLSAIAVRYGTSVSRLKRVNKLNGSTIRVGQKLRIPLNDVGG
jgi:N-acetylmuramoyl-L-alanine amidase